MYCQFLTLVFIPVRQITLTVSQNLSMLLDNETYRCHFAGDEATFMVEAVGSGATYMCNITGSIPTQYEGLATGYIIDFEVLCYLTFMVYISLV